MKYKIEWQFQDTDSEWIYLGIGEDINVDLLFLKINVVFKEKNILIELGREDSKEVEKDKVEAEIMSRLGNLDFIICDKTFSDFIEFNRIGAFRIGTRKTTTYKRE